jgi:hypothetical protein
MTSAWFYAAPGMVKTSFGQTRSFDANLFSSDSRQSPKKLITLSTLNLTAILER